MHEIHDQLASAIRRSPLRHYGDSDMRRDIHTLRARLVEGIADAAAIPEVSTDNTRAAHDLLGCALFMGILHTLHASVRDGVPDHARACMHGVVMEAITNVAARLIFEGPANVRACGHQEGA